MIDIPKDRKPLRPGKLTLLLGLTAMLFLLIFFRFGDAAASIGGLAGP